MTNEEAKKRLEVRLICANCPEDKMCYDSHLHSICEYTDYCDEVSIEEAVKVAIEVLKQEPCEDAISRQAVLDILKDKWNMFTDANDAMQESIDTIESLRPVSSSEKPNKSEWQHDHEILKAYSDGANEVLDKIKTDIEGLKHEHTDVSGYRWWDNAIDNALSIIDRHINAEGGDKE